MRLQILSGCFLLAALVLSIHAEACTFHLGGLFDKSLTVTDDQGQVFNCDYNSNFNEGSYWGYTCPIANPNVAPYVVFQVQPTASGYQLRQNANCQYQ